MRLLLCGVASFLLVTPLACGSDDADGSPDTSSTSSSGEVPGSSGSAPGASSGATPTDGGVPEGPPAPPLECPAGSSAAGAPPNGAIPGALGFPSPTVHNASIVWSLQGDENDDARGEFRFRKRGAETWRHGLPLRRVPAMTLERVPRSHELAGSVFDLEPGSEYEVEARLQDDDGGCEIRTGAFRTRDIPTPMANAPVKPVTPATLAATLAAAVPGDILELAAGEYSGFVVPRDGEAGKPIVIRGLAGARVRGEIGAFERAFFHLEGLEIDGRVRINGCHDAAIVRNTIRAVASLEGHGIVAYLRSENLYIADNVIEGLTTWRPEAFGVNGDNVGEGVQLSGPGHSVEHNRVRGFRDCLSTLEGDEAIDQYSIDFVENDLDTCADDGIEADFCLHGCRSIRNRITNAFIALSSQPGLGGPNYFVRNVIANAVLHAFKPLRGSVGDVYLHNTIIKSGDAFSVYADVAHPRQMSRGNLFLGGPGGTFGGYPNGDGAVIMLERADVSDDYDYDGFGSAHGDFRGKLGAVQFDSLAALQASTSEKHAVQLDASVFAQTVTVPTTPMPALAAPDLRLRAASAAIDAAQPLANVNDGYAGAAPDLGAYELGAPLPQYGPR